MADGAGSAPLGQVGAAIATQAAVEAIHGEAITSDLPSLREEWQPLLTRALQAARTAIELEAATRDVAARQLATTLILLVATPQLVAAAQVGDGAVVTADDRGGIAALTVPQHGEYVNETTFVVSADYLATAQFVVRPGRIRHVVMFSDGLERLALKMPEGTPRAPFLAPIFRFAEEVVDHTQAQAELTAFLGSSRLRERTDDDITLLLATWT